MINNFTVSLIYIIYINPHLIILILYLDSHQDLSISFYSKINLRRRINLHQCMYVGQNDVHFTGGNWANKKGWKFSLEFFILPEPLLCFVHAFRPRLYHRILVRLSIHFYWTAWRPTEKKARKSRIETNDFNKLDVLTHPMLRIE